MELPVDLKIKHLLQELREHVKMWRMSNDDDWELEEEVIYRLTIENIAIEYIPVNNNLLKEDCIKEVTEENLLSEKGIPHWKNFYSIINAINNGKYGDVPLHILKMAKIVIGM